MNTIAQTITIVDKSGKVIGTVSQISNPPIPLYHDLGTNFRRVNPSLVYSKKPKMPIKPAKPKSGPKRIMMQKKNELAKLCEVWILQGKT
jgi:hypothetical protein